MSDSINTSGIRPVEYKVLVKLDDMYEADPLLKRAREAGIELAASAGEREQMAQVKGTLVAAGDNAFIDWKWKPPAGVRVMVAKYAGLYCEGDDGQEYRLCNDKDIAAVLTGQQ